VLRAIEYPQAERDDIVLTGNRVVDHALVDGRCLDLILEHEVSDWSLMYVPLPNAHVADRDLDRAFACHNGRGRR
jgi:hypothetical protein